MKRDMELIRLLLQETEGEQPKPDLSGYSEKAKLYHLELMEEAGLIVADFLQDQEGEVVGAAVRRLTNAGHDLLDDSRNETIWKKFKEISLKLGGCLSLPVATELLKMLAREMVGLH